MIHRTRASGLRKRYAAGLLAAVLCLLPFVALAAEFGSIHGGSLRLRSAPDANAVVLGAYPTGTWVEVLERGGSWHRVRVDGKTGYMSARYITLGGTAATTDAAVTGASGYINLRENPSLTARVLATYPNGTRVKILANISGFYHVQVGAVTGYMTTTLVRPDNVALQTTAIIRTQNGGNLNLRENPSMSARVLQSFRSGTKVNVIQRNSEWTQVRISGVTGFMRTAYLSFGEATLLPPVTGSTTGIVHNPRSSQVLNLRERPSLDARVLAYYYNGTRVDVLEQGTVWHRVRVDGTTGYMMAEYLDLVPGGVAVPPPTGSFAAVLINPNGGSVVNFRVQPGLDTVIYATYSVGTSATVLEWGTNWCMVRIGDQVGYVSTYFLRY